MNIKFDLNILNILSIIENYDMIMQQFLSILKFLDWNLMLVVMLMIMLVYHMQLPGSLHCQIKNKKTSNQNSCKDNPETNKF